VIHCEYPLEVHTRTDLVEGFQQCAVDNQKAIFGVVGNIAKFVRMQSQVQRVQNRTGSRDAEVGLEMLMLIPHQGGDAISWLDASMHQRG